LSSVSYTHLGHPTVSEHGSNVVGVVPRQVHPQCVNVHLLQDAAKSPDVVRIRVGRDDEVDVVGTQHVAKMCDNRVTVVGVPAVHNDEALMFDRSVQVAEADDDGVSATATVPDREEVDLDAAYGCLDR